MPLPVRVAAGLVVTALEQARRFPDQLAELPVTAASRAVQTGMRVQQRVTQLAIKGDEVFALFRRVEDTPPWARFDEDEAPQEPPSGAEPAAKSAGDAPRTPENAISAVVPGPRRHGELDEAEVARELAPGYPDTAAHAKHAEPAAPDAGAERSEDTRSGPSHSNHSATNGRDTNGRDINGRDTNGRDTNGGSPASTGTAATAPPGPAALPGYDELSLAQLRGKLRALSLTELESLLEHEQAHQDRAPFITMLSNRIVTVRSR